LHPTRAVILLVVLWSYALKTAAEVQWHTEQGCRWSALRVGSEGKTGFTLLPADQTGITFTNDLEEEERAANRVLENGSGVALGDFDNDGLVDIFLCGLDRPCVLYKNLGGMKFRDVTKETGLAFDGRLSRGAVFADINGDGWLDLLVSATGRGVSCFLNDGHGHFQDFTAAAGTASTHGSLTLALADVDGNGTLDLYIGNNRTDDIRDRGKVDILMDAKRQLVIPPQLRDRLIVLGGQVLEFGEPDQLLLNDGQGHFKAVDWTDGTFLDDAGRPLRGPPRDWTLTVTFRDVNNDGAPDLYCCSDFWTPDRFWLNDGHGRFRAAPRLTLRHTSASSMGVDFADINRDGFVDFVVLDMLSRDPRLRRRQMLAQNSMDSPPGMIEDHPQVMRNTCFLNRGDGTFTEIADFAGLPASEWSWYPLFLDVDLDGFEDLVIPAGHVKDVQDLDASATIQTRQRSYDGIADPIARHKAFVHDKLLNNRLYPPLEMPVIAFRNLHNLRFEEVTSQWGTGDLGVHHGIAMADLDNDGDLDLVVNNLGKPAGIYRNDSIAPRVAVRLKGLAPNTQGIGAKVRLLNGAIPMQSSEVVSGGRYLSGADTLLVFAAGAAVKGMSIEVSWRSGKSSRVSEVNANCIYEISEEGAQTSVAAAPTIAKATWFEDFTDHLNHTHVDPLFDDFLRQPLLPRRLSQLGPGVAWFDVNGDGHEDLIVGSGRGGQLGVFYGDGHGGFVREISPPFGATVARDQTSILCWMTGEGTRGVITGSANYEHDPNIGSAVQRYQVGAAQPTDLVPAWDASTGPLALGSVYGEGAPGLFVGGRAIGGRWPEAASSRLFRLTNGTWALDVENSKVLERVGLVTGAVFTDLAGQGWPDLVLACEWGPVRVFHNDHGHLREQTKELGLDQFTGWWTGVATGDFDGDGRQDLVVGNWGLNSDYHPTVEHPVEVVYGDLSGQGNVDIFEGEYDPSIQGLGAHRQRDVLAASIPALLERAPTHKAFSESSLDQLLGEATNRTQRVSARTLSSMVFLNRGDRFEARELPLEAQLAPAFGVAVGDFDGDGHEDILLSQNFFENLRPTPRLDAGRGVWLRGDGAGGFLAVSGQESGITVYGEGRGVALADFDEDGRLDVVVTQNAARTRLFHNRGGSPGLRVRLKGPPGNPLGFGATLRLEFGNRQGPAREIHAGSGYWSQDSPVQVLACPETPTRIGVRWPGGRYVTADVPPGSREISVDTEGRVTK